MSPKRWLLYPFEWTLTHATHLAGFATMFFAQLNIDPECPGWLLVLFSIVSGLLISVHLFALLVAVCVLPNLEAYKCVP